MNRSTIVVCGLGYIVARQALRIRRLNIKLRCQSARHAGEAAHLDAIVAQLQAENVVLRHENVAWCQQAVEGKAS